MAVHSVEMSGIWSGFLVSINAFKTTFNQVPLISYTTGCVCVFLKMSCIVAHVFAGIHETINFKIYLWHNSMYANTYTYEQQSTVYPLEFK